MTTVKDTLHQINSVLKESTDGPYKNYSCKTVSWDDVQRGTVGGNLSCWGANITDTRLYAKDGRQLFTVRGDNWNERLGKVTADDLALVASDEDGGGGLTGLRPVTLRTVLSDINKYGAYANLDIESIADQTLDEEISVRFQTTFLPVDKGEKMTLEFAPEAYNYNTTDDEDPRNLILLCTSQGLAIQQDGEGAKKLFHHVKSGDEVKRYWLEAESSSHKVGGSQVESSGEESDAVKRGKATSTVIGTKAIGTRFNVLMTIQVPLEQQKKERVDLDEFCCLDTGMALESCEMFDESYTATGVVLESCEFGECEEEDEADEMGVVMKTKIISGRPPVIGKSSAARVSRGSEVDTWSGITVNEPKRHPHEHVTATVVMYYTCSGGVPAAEEVKSAIDDLEELYKSIETNGNLKDEAFDFMKSELTVKDTIDAKKKADIQPPLVLLPDLPEDGNVFPS